VRLPCRHRRLLAAGLLLLVGLPLLIGLVLPMAAPATPPEPPAAPSSYALARQAPFNRPSHYPTDLRPDPALYRPHAAWMGRLILPGPDAAAPAGLASRDWVWIELEQAPAERAEWIGRRLPLTWKESAELQGLVRTVTTDIHLGAAARREAAAGNVVPERLDGRRAVGPLRSLAGARPEDDVIVQLEEPQPASDAGGRPLLRIGRPPVQITGRWTALVRLLEGPLPSPGRSEGAEPEPDLFRVRHFNRRSGRFDGPVETVRIPTQPRDRFDRRFFDPRGLARSPAGSSGWYLHGSPDPEGRFTVQAIEPRRLTLLDPDRTIHGTGAGLRHVLHANWSDTPGRRGRISRFALWPDHARRQLLSRRDSASGSWQLGDQALVLHSFGGIGGPDGEPTPGFTVTGHFAFGQAEVVQDPFSGSPRFAIRYHQIYANNPNGIVSGTQDWSAFSGDLQRGWLGTRPISDVLVRGDAPLLRELAIQAEVLMARYRSGDGSGVATVTPGTSCVQDSGQALFIAIAELRRRAAASAFVAAARAADGPAAETLRQLASLGRDLEDLLTPFGMVRADWRRNASLVAAASDGSPTPARPVAGIAATSSDGFQSNGGLMQGLLSWRSMLPRRAHDDLAGVFLRHGSPLWILRTNQIPGADPRLEPLAPTLLLGRLPVLSTLLRRFSDALFTRLNGADLALTAALLAAYAAVVLPPGLANGLLRRSRPPRPAVLALRAGGLFLMPALGEELLFRVALLPHPLEGSELAGTIAWAALSVGLFVLYHPLAARFWYPPGRRLFRDPRFLVPCTLLGMVTVIAYQASGSLWPPVLLHAVVVVVWLELLGGRGMLAAGREGTQG
jgi:predicted Abi (CAAX) family protease